MFEYKMKTKYKIIKLRSLCGPFPLSVFNQKHFEENLNYDIPESNFGGTT